MLPSSSEDMTMKLREATVAEQNAAFDAVYQRLEADISRMPGFYQNIVRSKLESPEGRAEVLLLVDLALEAAEAIRQTE